MSNIILRDYQADGLSRIRSLLKQGIRRVCYVLATGGGKTAVASFMLDGSAQKKLDGWFVVHRKELAYQTSEALTKYGIPHGIVAAGERLEPWHHIQLVLIGSLRSRLQYLRAPKIIIPDETHHARAKMWEDMFALFPSALIVGLTATPMRLDGKGLGKHYDRLVIGPPMRELIDRGFLADYRLFAPPSSVHLDDVHSLGGDYKADELKAALERSAIVGDAIGEYTKHCAHMRALVRSIDIGFSMEVAERFRQAGYRAAHVDGTTDKLTRRNIFRDFRTGAIEIMSQVELAGEGVDIPGIQAAIDLRPSMSLVMARQFWGRALRMYEGKGKAFLMDHAGNAAVHGFPDDEIPWSLEDVKQSLPAPKIFKCDECFASFKIRHSHCPECGARMGPGAGMGGGRLRPEEIDGTLHEMTDADREKARQKRIKDQEKFKARHQRKKALRACTTIEELEAYGALNGYKPGWGTHIFEARKRTIDKYRGGRGYR